MNFCLVSVSKVELWNFRNSSISVRFWWWTSRNPSPDAIILLVEFDVLVLLELLGVRDEKLSRSILRWSFVSVIKQSPNLCTGTALAHQVSPLLSTIFSLGDCRKLIVSTVRVSDTKTKMIDVALSHRFPRSIDHDRHWRRTDTYTFRTAVIGLSSVCRSEYLAECHVIHVLVHDRDLEGEVSWWVLDLVENMGLGLITFGVVEDVAADLTPVGGRVAQVFQDLLVELRLLLVAEVEEGEEEDIQEEGWEVESGVGRVKEKQPLTWMIWRWCERCKTHSWAMNVSVMIKDCKTMRASSVNVVMRHAIVEVRCVNVEIGVHIVVLSVLLVVVRVVPIFHVVIL